MKNAIYPLFIVLFLTAGLLTACEEESWMVQEQPEEPLPPQAPSVGEPALPENTSELWKEFLAYRQQGTPSRLADFSYAGYAYGEKNIPVTGISITGSLKQVLSSIRLSCKEATFNGYCGPEKAILNNMKIF